jgi:hypothetical protein
VEQPRPPAPSEAPAASARVAPSATARSTARSSLSTEIELIDEARRALQEGNPTRARSLLDRYAREAPHGELARDAAKLRADVDAAMDGGRTIP